MSRRGKQLLATSRQAREDSASSRAADMAGADMAGADMAGAGADIAGAARGAGALKRKLDERLSEQQQRQQQRQEPAELSRQEVADDFKCLNFVINSFAKRRQPAVVHR